MSHFDLKKKEKIKMLQNQERYKIVHGTLVKLVSNWEQNVILYMENFV